MGLASAGDLDGDGYADVIVGAPGLDAMTGAVYVFRGSATGLAAHPSATLHSPDGIGAGFGMAIAGAGDVNGDGVGDVIVGANGAEDTAGARALWVGGA